MKWEQLCKLAFELPEVDEDVWFRTPALKVRGKGFVRLKENGQDVVFLLDSVDEQEFLIGAQPDLYFITDHYRGWPAVLARLRALSVPEARMRLEHAWRRKAPKALIKRLDAGDGGEERDARAAGKKPGARAADKKRVARRAGRKKKRGRVGAARARSATERE